MDNFSDDQIIGELLKRLQAKDKAYHDLVMLTKKLESLNAKLLESEKVKSHFLSNIRNEINNPLTAVLTLCEFLIQDEAQDPGTVSSAVKTMHKEAFNLNFQLRNIFAAAEFEAGESMPSVSRVDAVSLIRSTADSFQHKALEKGIDIRLDMGDELQESPLFGTDSEKLERIVSNLLSNAIEFSSNGSVDIKAWKEGRRLKVSVTDSGAGIDQRDHGVIFERFRQLETGATKTHGGHGLGLSVTRAAVEALNGMITVESRKGEGAVFTVSIPEMNGAMEAAFSDDGNNFFFDAANGERF